MIVSFGVIIKDSSYMFEMYPDLVPFLQKQLLLIHDGYATSGRQVMLQELQDVKKIDDLN